MGEKDDSTSLLRQTQVALQHERADRDGDQSLIDF
jgi:hypothetical protein